MAQKSQLSDGRAVVVIPLTYNFQPVLALAASANASKVDKLDEESQSIQSKLLIYKDIKGSIQADLLQLIPTEEDRKKNKRVKANSFSGTVLVSKQAGGLPTAGYIYRDGKLTDRFKPLAQQGGRLLNETRCGTYLYYLQGTTPDNLHVEGTTISIRGQTYDIVFIAAPCDSSGGGGGLGGGSGGNNGGGGNGGGDGSGGGGGGNFFEDSGELSSSQAYNFIYYMQNERNPAIGFNNDEMTLIRQNPEIIASLSAYINQYGVKPGLDGMYEDAEGGDPTKATLKVVGRDSYNEDTDYRLYERECEAYTYLFNKALRADAEYGAYITNKGIIVLPNSQAYTASNGQRRIIHRYWQLKGTTKPVVFTDKGTYTMLGVIHTHPGGRSGNPSDEDLTVAREKPQVNHYIINAFAMRQFFSDGTTQPYKSAADAPCP